MFYPPRRGGSEDEIHQLSRFGSGTIPSAPGQGSFATFLFWAQPPLIVLNVKIMIHRMYSRRACGKCGKAERFCEAFPSSCGNPHQENAAEGHRFVRGFP